MNGATTRRCFLVSPGLEWLDDGGGAADEAAAGGGALTLYDPEGNRIHALNATAAAILACCDGRLTASEIAAELQRAFALATVPLAEVEAFLAQAIAEGLVREQVRRAHDDGAAGDARPA